MAVRDEIREAVLKRINAYLYGKELPCAAPKRLVEIAGRILSAFSQVLPDVFGAEGLVKIDNPETGMRIIVELLDIYCTTVTEFSADPAKAAALKQEIEADYKKMEENAEKERQAVTARVAEMLGKAFGADHVIAVELERKQEPPEEPKAEVPKAEAQTDRKWN